MRTWVDCGTHTALGLCECGWRTGVVDSRGSARRHLAIHSTAAHPGDDDARQALWRHLSRHAADSASVGYRPALSVA